MGETVDFNYKECNKLSLVKFFFDEDDIKKVKDLKEKYSDAVKECYIPHQIQIVSDSSSRNGYCILEINNQEQLEDVLKILGIEN